MILLTALFILILGWWVLHLLELGIQKQDGAHVLAAMLVAISTITIGLVAGLLHEIFSGLNP